MIEITVTVINCDAVAVHLIHKWRNARKSLGRVYESETKGASIQMKTKQSMEIQVVSLVIPEISHQLGSDS